MAKRDFGTEGRGQISVRVMDFEHGSRDYEDVKLIRIKSRLYSLLVMEDYMPALGEVNGTVELLTDSEEIPLGAIHGFFMNRHNLFSLLVVGPVQPEEDEAQDREAAEEEAAEEEK